MLAHFSNRIENLYQELKGRLFSKAPHSAFQKRLIIVPSPAMRHWLMRRMANDKEIGIAAGVTIMHLESAAKELIATHAVNPSHFPKQRSEMEVSLAIEAEIRSVLQSIPLFSPEEKKLWSPLIRYLRPPNRKLSTKIKENRRILALSHKLAGLFLTYGNFAAEMLCKWAQEESSAHWQSELWKRCVNENFPKKMEWKSKNTAVHIFGLSFISHQNHLLFLHLASAVPVFYYVLSPCQIFWSEILSDRECVNLIKFWQHRGVKEAESNALEELLYDRNPLLANWGRVGREMTLQLENSSIQTAESYAQPQNFQNHPIYRQFLSDDVLFCGKKERLNLLDYVQADIMLMRNPQQDEKISIGHRDQSIQVHCSASPMREVQTLYDTLMGILAAHKNDIEPILPEDMVVMAPDIMFYEPYVRMVFSEDEDGLDFQIMDLNVLPHHSLTKGFVKLLSLAKSRWDVATIFELFENPQFQGKHGFKPEDIAKIKRWIKDADIRWGVDPSHRREILNRELGDDCSIDESPAGTWRHGIDRLLLGMVMRLSDRFPSDLSPLNTIGTTQARLFGNFMQLMRGLKEDLKPFFDGATFALSTWSLYLKALLESYFDLSTQEEADQEERQNLLKILENLSCNSKFEDKAFTFDTILFHLLNAIENQNLCYKESHLHAVRFCSMLPMRAVPAKVIVLLGMSEDNYPRSDDIDSLNLMTRPSCDYCPSRAEFDRYFFLETFLSAREYFICSYTSTATSDGKELPVSLLVSELLNYLDTGYSICGQMPSEVILTRFPCASYDKMLFQGESGLQSYSQASYLAAKAFYKKETQGEQHRFIPNFMRKATRPQIPKQAIDLKSLLQLSRNPVEMFLKHKYGIYLPKKEDREKKNEERFELSGIEKAVLKKKLLKGEAIIASADKEGILPIGPFRNYYLDALSAETAEIKRNLADLGIHTIQSLEMSEACSTAVADDKGNWRLPPLKCRCYDSEIKIVGYIPEVTDAGMLVFCKADKKEVLKFWPQYLVYLCVLQHNHIPFQDSVIFAKEGKIKKSFLTDPFSCLEKYLRYYFDSLNNISPLIPEWVPDLIDADTNRFEKVIQTTLATRNKHFYNDDLRWIVQGSNYPDPKVIVSNWEEIARELFGELFENWYGTRRTVRGKS